MRLCVRLCVHLCVSLCAFVCASVCVSVCASVCACLFSAVCVCVGMFTYCAESGNYWFNMASIDAESEFHLIGIVSLVVHCACCVSACVYVRVCMRHYLCMRVH